MDGRHGTLTLGAGKTATVSNTLTFTGTDGSTVAFGAGGTVLYSGGALGTPSSATLSNGVGVPLSTGVTGRRPFANLTQIAGLSVLGIAGNSTADCAAITAASDGQILRRSGTSIGFGTVPQSSVDNLGLVLISTQVASSSATTSRGLTIHTTPTFWLFSAANPPPRAK